MKNTLVRSLVIPLLALSLSTGCSAFGSASLGTGAEFGATPGGIKDLSSARDLVANGQVPPPSALLVEAAFSEHDLPLTGTPCVRTLCLRSALGIAPDLDGKQSGWLQIGMSSNVDPATYGRPTIHAILTVDVSGSMGWDLSRADSGSGYTTAGRLAYLLANRIAGQLTPGDSVSLVTYGSSVSTVFESIAGDDPMIVTEINRLKTNGSTNMEAGLRRAYEIASRHKGVAVESRVFLFSDEQPNVGATTATEFQSIVGNGASDGIGITLFGLGLGHSNELTERLSHLRGANAFSLAKQQDVDALMQDSWPWMATPLAYDLKVNVTPTSGFTVTQNYGFPGVATSSPSLDVATVFLSKRKGALLVQLGGTGTNLTGLGASSQLGYNNLSGQPISDSLSSVYSGNPLDARNMYFQQPSVGKTVALAMMVSNMHKAAELYRTSPTGAVSLMEKVVTRIVDDAAALADPTFDREVKLAQDVLALMKKGAPQGDLYPR